MDVHSGMRDSENAGKQNHRAGEKSTSNIPGNADSKSHQDTAGLQTQTNLLTAEGSIQNTEESNCQADCNGTSKEDATSFYPFTYTEILNHIVSLEAEPEAKAERVLDEVDNVFMRLFQSHKEQLETNDIHRGKSNIEEKKPKPKRNGHDPNAISMMREWLRENSQYPYAKLLDIIELSEKTSLTDKQVHAWLNNERSRLKNTGVNIDGFNFKEKKHHPQFSVDIMEAWATGHSESPSTFEKEELAAQANLTLDQVSTWFQNRRKKSKKLRNLQSTSASQRDLP